MAVLVLRRRVLRVAVRSTESTSCHRVREIGALSPSIARLPPAMKRPPRGPARRPLPPFRPPQKNPSGPTHRLTLVGYRAECLHSCQYFVESPCGTLTLNCECTHEFVMCRMCGWKSLGNLMIRLRVRLDCWQSRHAVESPCRFCWFGYCERKAVISIEFQAVERKRHPAERPFANGYSTRYGEI